MKYYVNGSFLSLKSVTGISRFAISMVQGLKKEMGEDIVILAPKYISHPELAKELNVVQIGLNTNRYIRDSNKARLLWEQVDLFHYLRNKNSPLLISFGNTAPIFYKNQIVSVLDLFYEHYKDILPKHHEVYPVREVNFYRYVVPRIIRSAKRIITISEYSKNDIMNTFKIKNEKIDVIYPSIPEIFISGFKKIDYINSYGRYILGVSSVNPHKNFDGLIRAFKEANLIDTKLLIVGNLQKDQDKYSLYSTYKDDSSIVFKGFVDDVELICLYQNALFFAFPSFFEGFGIPPLEAMACGCPTLVSKVASLPEICQDASYYVDPYDLESIVKGMKALSSEEDLRNRLSYAGFDRVREFLAVDSVNQLVNLLKRF